MEQLVVAGDSRPRPNCDYYLREHDFGLGRREPEVERYLPDQVAVQRIIRLGNT